MIRSRRRSSRALAGMSLVCVVPAASRAVRARVIARTAVASMLIRVQRIQEFQQVVRPWSRPQMPLASWKSSSTPSAVHHVHKIGQGDGAGRVAAVEGEFAGVAVAAYEHEGVPRLLVVGGVVGADVKHGPVVGAVALQAVAGA